MALNKIRDFLTRHGMDHKYFEEDGCGSIDFLHRGLSYHIWEFPPEDQGAESNVRTAGRMEVYSGDYEDQILAILESDFC